MTKSRVNELDLFRFVAAMSVVFFHYGFRGYAADNMMIVSYPALAPIAKYGYLGVMLFFIISGFVILMTASHGSTKRFAISRVTRLYPALWICCTLTFLTILVLGGSRYHASLHQYLTNMTMFSGFFNVRSIDGSYWSLFVEIRFYVMVAFLLLIGQIARAELVAVAWLLVTILFASVPMKFMGHSFLASWLIPDYAPYFIVGAIFFMIHENGLSIGRLGMVCLSYAIAIVQAVRTVPILDQYYKTSFSGLVIVSVITLFYIAFLLVALKKTGPLRERTWITLGALTYPLYLMHQYIGFMIFNRYHEINRYFLLFAIISLMLAASYIISHTIEPFCAKRLRRILTDGVGAQKSTAYRGDYGN